MPNDINLIKDAFRRSQSKVRKGKSVNVSSAVGPLEFSVSRCETCLSFQYLLQKTPSELPAFGFCLNTCCHSVSVDRNGSILLLIPFFKADFHNSERPTSH